MGEKLVDELTREMGEDAMKCPVLRKELYMMLGVLKESLIGLSDRIKVLEGREYKGVHVEGEAYTRGQMVSHKGGMWHCNRPTKQRPGDGNDWSLAVKAGRDGKDMR